MRGVLWMVCVCVVVPTAGRAPPPLNPPITCFAGDHRHQEPTAAVLRGASPRCARCAARRGAMQRARTPAPRAPLPPPPAGLKAAHAVPPPRPPHAQPPYNCTPSRDCTHPGQGNYESYVQQVQERAAHQGRLAEGVEKKRAHIERSIQVGGWGGGGWARATCACGWACPTCPCVLSYSLSPPTLPPLPLSPHCHPTLSPPPLSPHSLSPPTPSLPPLSPHSLSPPPLSPHSLSPPTVTPLSLSPPTLSLSLSPLSRSLLALSLSDRSLQDGMKAAQKHGDDKKLAMVASRK